MGRFSHLLEGKVTPVTRHNNPRVTGKVQSIQHSSTGYTGYTEKTSMSARSAENAKENFNDEGRERTPKSAPLARELSFPGVTGVTGVTALKNNDNPGYTSFFEGVTGVTALKNNNNSDPVPVPEYVSDVIDLAEVQSAVASCDPSIIDSIVIKYPDLTERAAIREFEGGVDRAAANRAALQDILDEVHPGHMAGEKLVRPD